MNFIAEQFIICKFDYPLWTRLTFKKIFLTDAVCYGTKIFDLVMFPYRLASECTQKLEILRPRTSYKVLLCNIFGTLIHPPAPSQAKESFPGVAASYIITLMRPCPKHIEKESSEVS